MACLVASPVGAQNAQSIEDVPTAIRNANAITTYIYDVTPDKLVELVFQDIQEGRQKFSKSNPSLLDPHIRYAIAQGNFIDAGNGTQRDKARVVASGTGAMCITQVVINVPISGVPNPAEQFISRSCSQIVPSGEASNFWANWARSTIGSTSTGLGRLLNVYNLKVEANYNSATPNSGLRGVNFRPINTGPAMETHGTIYFNTYGTTATSTEIYIHSASWQ